MNKRIIFFVNVTVVLLSALLATAITMALQGQSGLLKSLAWTIFFASINSPILFMFKDRPAPCTAWIYRLWRKG